MRPSCSPSPWCSGWVCSVAEAMVDPEAAPPGWRRVVGRVVGASILVIAVVAAAVGAWQWENRPQTDDATVRANFVGIAPKVNGHILELPILANQQVTQG